MKFIGSSVGLADNMVRTMMLHQNGMIYIGTSVGLSVYDGNNVINISTSNQQEVKKILPLDNDSLILIRDNGISIVDINNYGFREKNYNDAHSNKIINGVKAGGYLFCASNDGLIRVDLKSLEYVNLNDGNKTLPKEMVYYFSNTITFSENNKWVYLAHRKGLVIWDVAENKRIYPKALTEFLKRDSSLINHVYSEGGMLYFKQTNGNWGVFNEKTNSIKVIFKKIAAGEFYPNNILYKLRTSVYRFDYTSNNLDSFDLGVLYQIKEFAITNRDEIILATQHGLVIIKKKERTQHVIGLSHLHAIKYIELQRKVEYGASYFFNRKNGIAEYDTVKGITRFYVLPEQYSDGILTIFPFKYGHVIVAGNKGYFGFNLKDKKYYRLRLFSDANEQVISTLRIITGSYDSITQHIILCPYKHPVLIKDFRIEKEWWWNGYDRNWFRTVRSLFYLGNYEYLLGANGNDGLIRINFKTGKGKYLPSKVFSKAGNNSAIVNQILPFGKYLYLATTDGLIRCNWEMDSLKAIFMEGFPFHDQVYAMSIINNELYVSVRNALCKLISGDELIKIAYFDNSVGGGIPFYAEKKIKLYVRDLLVCVEPRDLSVAPSVYISHVGFENFWYYVGDKKTTDFDYGVGSLQILFGVKMLGTQEFPVLVKYRFSGSPAWQILKGTSIQTGNLSFGQHKMEYFSIQAGIMSPTQTFIINILRPWWASLPFFIACALVLIAGFWIALRITFARKSEKERNRMALVINTSEKERLRISRDFHDGVGAKLSSIKLIAESSKGKPNLNLLAKLPEIVDEIVLDIREIINELSPQILKQYGVGFALETYINNLNKNLEHITVETKISENVPRLDEITEINIFRICQEVINNALKHSGGTWIGFSLQSTESGIMIEIKDNGNGINSSSAAGHGFSNIRSRISTLNGEMTISSSSSNGTVIKIVLPLEA